MSNGEPIQMNRHNHLAFLTPLPLSTNLNAHRSNTCLTHQLNRGPFTIYKSQPQPLIKQPTHQIQHTFAIQNTLSTEDEARPSSNAEQQQQAVASNQNRFGDNGSGMSYRLTAGERARTLVRICKSATLCTASVRHSGVPFGSHVDFVQDTSGSPVFLLAANANHTRNLACEPRCSLFCQPASSAGQDGCRATLVGKVSPLNGPDEIELRELYEETHAHAKEALQYADLFKFYRMHVDDVLFVSGYGVLSQWVTSTDFAHAMPDPLAFDAPQIRQHINDSKQMELKRLCRVFLDVDEVMKCTMTSLDRLGFDLRVRDAHAQTSEYRVAFRENVNNRFDVQSALVKAFQEAWEKENGFDETWEGEDSRPTVLYYGRN